MRALSARTRRSRDPVANGHVAAARIARAGRRTSELLDSDALVRGLVDDLHAAVRPRTTALWMVRDGELPVLAHSRGPRETDEPPEAVIIAARRAAWVDAQGSFALPLVAPRTGLIGVLHVAGMPPGDDLRAALADAAREAALALQAAGLYERAIAEKDKSEAILARVASGVIVTDSRGVVLQFNPGAERIAATPAGEAVGRSCGELLGLHTDSGPLDCSRGCALLEACRLSDTPDGIEVWRELADGRHQPLLAAASPVLDADGAVSEVVHSMRDITRLKEADEAKTLFLATASHELKTPLTVIRGFAQGLRANPDWPDSHRERALEAMEIRAQQLTRIVERILLSSRIESGKLKVNLVEVDLRAMLVERAAALRATTGRDVTLRIDDDLPEALCDEEATITIVDHLLDNAVKYSPDGGAVAMIAAADDHSLLLTVADSGIGMDDEQLRHCFERFWQAESGDRRRFGGTGIGLYIVRSLVEACRGSITAESEPGRGTVFTVRLPRAGVTAEPPPPDPEPVGVALSNEPSIVREFMRQIGVPSRRTQ